ncbi:Iron(III) dicitrate-binding protein [Methanosarcina sp. MTP4]|uniref:iron ABC transporter substrate-binding protein n=1 Tax=Methanosarcina sp. MTP4 TaxID=1434100 RepID=UPI0006155E08|nr:iron ABC transporter substrate-binding protein [Methanosarcina sp. MTP4]AKB26002.1 Iron(III) dicitrate-binding protein [Methanosarcina sp. MTP4]
MIHKKYLCVLLVLVLVAACVSAGCVGSSSESDAGDESGHKAAKSSDASSDTEMITITDGLGRTVTVPKNPEKVVCQGAGALRYLCYLGAQDAVVGVEDIELRKDENRRPYAIANPWLQEMPLIGEFRGNTDPEKVVAADPDVIFWTYVPSPADADEFSAKTGIPVVALNCGNLGVYREDMYSSLRIMGEVMDRGERAEEVVEFFDAAIADLESRTADIPDEEKMSVYVGGIAYAGPHGFQSTEPTYPPFMFINAKNVAGEMGTDHADASKEAIMEWNPDILFVDLSTYQTTPSALDELKEDPAYLSLTAVKKGEVYGVLPYNWYSSNHGSVLAASYYVGTVIYPEEFEDIDSVAKADEIYTFLLGQPVYDMMEIGFDGGFGKLSLD